MTRKAPARPPKVLLILGVVGALVFILPLVGLIARTPFSELGSLVLSDTVLDALRISIITSVLSLIHI